ncbi:MAG: peptidase M48 [Deltaproteobacteria bacterium CG07_land_8_20_14_0_80_60_11]|nr:MAG: peptidase M48 [Deltaproteobacteria bacterium CG07_land_8_20_14_0_80_60_11]
MRRLACLVLLAAAPLLIGGCAAMAVAPIAAIAYKGASKATEAARPITDSEEYYVGRAVAARILGKYKLDQNPKLTQYVNEVGETVARKSSRPNPFRGYHFAVLDTQEVNAFACPGGIIFITRGLIQTCNSEDQLAAVLAHEVGHVANKDGINSISQARWTEVWTAMGKEAVTMYGGSVAAGLVSLFEGSIDDVFKTIVVNGYSRQAEETADAAALTELTKAGYDPSAMVALLTALEAKGKGASSGIFKTHPPTSERLARVKTSVGQSPAESQGEKIRTERFKKMAS